MKSVLCPFDECQWYHEAKPGGRKCYYGEPQCWRGWLTLMVSAVRLKLVKKRLDNSDNPELC